MEILMPSWKEQALLCVWGVQETEMLQQYLVFIEEAQEH